LLPCHAGCCLRQAAFDEAGCNNYTATAAQIPQ
jgi:hypothetical protein